MTVNDRASAWEAANLLFPTDYKKDERASKNAGYPIYMSTAEGKDFWISDLEVCLELNMGAKTIRINIQESEKGSEKALLSYLQSQMDDFKKWERRYGIGDRIVVKKLDAMIACKEMVEAIIREPVNLQQDGRVTTGF